MRPPCHRSSNGHWAGGDSRPIQLGRRLLCLGLV